MVGGGRPIDNLARLRERYRVVPHGVSLAIGAVEPLDADYLARLATLVDRIDPPWVTDHLCCGTRAGAPPPRPPAAAVHDGGGRARRASA